MTSFLAWLDSLFEKKQPFDPRNHVCWYFLAYMLGDMLDFTDEENLELMKIDNHDPEVLRELIREFVVPHYRYYPPESQKKIKDTLTYYLATDSPKLDWSFAAFPINLDPPGKLFYTLVWQALYGTDGPDPINPADYVEDCSSDFSNSLLTHKELRKKYNPENKQPSLANVLARIKAKKAQPDTDSASDPA